MLVQQGGTSLKLVGGEQPALFHHKEQLRFFLPPMGDAILTGMVRPLLDAAGRTALEAGEAILVQHEIGGVGEFEVRARVGESKRFTGEVIRKMDLTASKPKASQPATAEPIQVSLSTLDRLLGQALGAGASDLHLAEGERPMMRQAGTLRVLPGTEPLRGLELMLGGMIDEAGKARLLRGASVDLALDLADEGRVRGNVYRHRGGIAAAFRVIDRVAPPLDRLNLSVDLRSLTEINHGLILVCGPTGSGKSTTLAALARAYLETRGGVLLTLEDPIEFSLPAPRGSLVRQRAIGEHVPDFTTGLRDALREDPDILLVGEMRDPATIELALTAAETGHVVLSTLHARSAASAVERIVDAYPAARQHQIRVQLADALEAVIAQRLVPQADGSGRVAAVEVLRVTHAVAGMIREGRTEQIAHSLQAGGAAGMRPMARSLAELVRRGQVRLADARACADDPRMLDEYLAGS
jgi:twitching motility protein PilT